MRKQQHLLLCFLLLFRVSHGQEVFPYQLPSKELTDQFVNAGEHEFIFSKDGKLAIHTRTIQYPSVNDIAFPSIQTAGLYLNAQNFSPAVRHFIGELTIKNLATGDEMGIDGLPQPLRADHVLWSPDYKKIAFTQTSRERVDLYIIDLFRRRATKINIQPLHIATGKAYEWMPDNSLLYKIILQTADHAPAQYLVPAGTFVSDSKQSASVGNSLSGGVQSAFDEKTIDFYLTSQLVRNKGGKETRLGQPAQYTDFISSPDGNFILCNVSQKTSAAGVGYSEFPFSVRVLHKDGKTLKELFTIPVSPWQKRPRFFDWRPDLPSSVTWVQPIDTGSQKEKEFSSIFYSWDAPFAQEPKILFKTQMSLASVTWSNHGFALVNETDRRKGTGRTSLYNVSTRQLDKIYDQEVVNFNNILGMPVSTPGINGRKILMTPDSGKSILINNVLGNASSDYLPFLARLNVKTKALDFIWKGTNKKELVTQVGNAENLLLVIRRNGETAGYEYYLRQLTSPLKKNYVLATRKLDTPFDSATAQTIQYKRSDGVTLAGTLFLPKGYDPQKNGRLPLFIWSYPRRFYTRDEYSPENSTEKKYGIWIDTWEAPEMFVSRGYAVFYAGMPVLPDSNENANDHFIEQIVMNAEAAIKKLTDDGIADPHRVAVGGHSYGGGMTALLLAYTNLFKAGIGMSGGYNCSQTPFGFQDETRTYWQAKEIYDKMSAIRHADKIKTPLLLIHGSQDQVPGTLPLESENLFKAIHGNGGTVRYVNLPYENHGYMSKENILHLLWEMNQWLDKYLKNDGDK